MNGASFQPGIALGSWATIEGRNLASGQDNRDDSIIAGKLPTKLDGVTVTVGGQAAYPFYISPGQIHFLVPNVGAGPLPVTVTNSFGTSSAVTVTSRQYAPALFTWPGSQAVATRADYTWAVKNGTFAGTATVAAKPVEVLIHSLSKLFRISGLYTFSAQSRAVTSSSATETDSSPSCKMSIRSCGRLPAADVRDDRPVSSAQQRQGGAVNCGRNVADR